MTAHPAAYLRRSYVDPDSPGDISLEAQRAAVRKLAHGDGHNGDVVEYNDWGISADVAKAGKRIEYTRLLADMEAGNVSAVYAFDVDRLYRDPRDLIRLQDAAQKHGVRIVTTGGPLAIGDGDDPAAEAFAFIGSVFGRMELQKAKKRARAAREARRVRGDRFGHPPYGFLHVADEEGRIVRVPDPDAPVDTVLEAVRAAGSILGAVKVLNDRGIPSPKGGMWHTSALTRVVENHAPELLNKRGPSGRRVPARALLAQLIRCHCGQTLTPNVARGQLYCYRSHRIGTKAHGKGNVTEAELWPWIVDRAAKYKVRADRDAQAAQAVARREELIAQRNRLGLAMVDGLLSRDAAKERADAIDAELAVLADDSEPVEVPEIDWSGLDAALISFDPDAAAALNAALRSLIRYVQLDTDMRPLSIEWR